MPALVAQDTYVLLYECYNDESLYGGGDTAVLKFLPSEHPFARLLLREGSRLRKEKVAYELDLWQRDYGPVSGYSMYAEQWAEVDLGPQQPGTSSSANDHRRESMYFRRQRVVWLSDYGRPVEAHLNLCRYVEAWLKTQPVATFGQDDFPKTVTGMVRLDSSMHGEGDIARDIRDSQRFVRTAKANEVSVDADSITSASDISDLRFHVCRYLKDTILSLSEAEVGKVIANFCETQAHKQNSLFKSELLAQFQE